MLPRQGDTETFFFTTAPRPFVDTEMQYYDGLMTATASGTVKGPGKLATVWLASDSVPSASDQYGTLTLQRMDGLMSEALTVKLNIGEGDYSVLGGGGQDVFVTFLAGQDTATVELDDYADTMTAVVEWMNVGIASAASYRTVANGIAGLVVLNGLTTLAVGPPVGGGAPNPGLLPAGLAPVGAVVGGGVGPVVGIILDAPGARTNKLAISSLAIKPLIQQLGDNSFVVRERTEAQIRNYVKNLWDLGYFSAAQVAVDYLRSVQADPDPEISDRLRRLVNYLNDYCSIAP